MQQCSSGALTFLQYPICSPLTYILFLIIRYFQWSILISLGNLPQRGGGGQSGPAPAPHSGRGGGGGGGGMQYDPTQEITAARARSIKKLAFLVDELLDRIRGTECKIQDPLSSLSLLLAST